MSGAMHLGSLAEGALWVQQRTPARGTTQAFNSPCSVTIYPLAKTQLFRRESAFRPMWAAQASRCDQFIDQHLNRRRQPALF